MNGVIVPGSLLKRIGDWRRREPDLPNVSEAIRRLLELALDQGKKRH
jgi:hypothetical protein